MSNQNASQDDNQFPALMVHTGTAGTAETLKVVGDKTSGFLMKTDDSTEAAITIDYPHHEIHEGSYFTSHYQVDVGGTGIIDLHIATPNTTKWGHFTYGVTSEGEADLLFYENSVIGTAGTGVSTFNRNRNNSGTSTILVKHTPSITTIGDEIDHQHWGSGRGVGGGARENEEWVLKQNGNYVLRITNITANNNQISINLNWYEHTDLH